MSSGSSDSGADSVASGPSVSMGMSSSDGSWGRASWGFAAAGASSITVGWNGVQLSSLTWRGAGAGAGAGAWGGGGPTSESSAGLMLMMRIGMSITAGSAAGEGAGEVASGGGGADGGFDSRTPSPGSCGRVTSSSGMRSVRPRRRPGDESRALERDGGGSLSPSDGEDGTGATAATSVVVESGPPPGLTWA